MPDKSSLGDNAAMAGFLAFALVLLLLPAFIFWDMKANNWYPSGIDVTKLSFLYEVALLFYFTFAILALVGIVISIKGLIEKKEKPLGRVVGGIIAVAYVVPFILGLVYIPSYWKIVFSILSELI